MEQRKRYDEDQELPSPWEWVIIVLFSAAIMGFGWMVYLLIPDAPRQWDFGQLPDTPAEYIYSTHEPDPAKRVPRQIPQLPESQPQQQGTGEKSGRGGQR
jgi:hypothetical protein